MLSIFYGSQTGTGEAFSAELAETAKEKLKDIDCTVQVRPLDKVPKELFIKQRVVVLIVSSTGSGEAPDNATEFETYMKTLPAKSLSHMKYTIMGLGDMNYSDFQAFPIWCDERMAHVGAQKIHYRGIGDDCQDIEKDFEDWQGAGLWPALNKALRNATDADVEITEIPATSAQAKVYVFSDDANNVVLDKLKKDGLREFTHTNIGDRKAWEAIGKISRDSWALFMGSTKKILRNVNLNLDGGILRNVKCALLAEDEGQQKYLSRIGMEVVLHTQDASHFVKEVTEFLRPIGPADTLPPKASTEGNGVLAQWYFTATRLRIRKIVKFSPTLLHIEFEKTLGIAGDNVQILPENSAASVAKFDLQLSNDLKIGFKAAAAPFPITTIGKALTRYCDLRTEKSKNAPRSLAFFLEASRQVPRAYTLSGPASILLSVTPDGLCSTYLASLEPGATIHAHCKETILRCPQIDVPVVMVANGAGVGVFRGFLKHWEKNKRPTHLTLFYGCRNESEMAYEKELQEWLKSRHLDVLHVAFSRHASKPKQYVQASLQKHKDAVLQQLAKGYLYLCGGQDMCKDVIALADKWKVDRNRVVMEPWTSVTTSRSKK